MRTPRSKSRRAVALTQNLPAEASDRIHQLYAAIYQRAPSPQEQALALAYIKSAIQPVNDPPRVSAWTYGYGEFDASAGKLKSFTPLPYFNGTAWQGGAGFPDTALGWVQMTAAGGHPGNDRSRAVVRRWTAPDDGNYQLTSTLIHEPEVGDGVRAFVARNPGGLLKSTVLKHSKEQIDLAAFQMSKGDTLDFIVDIGEGLSHDQFLWSPTITLADNTRPGGDQVAQAWSAERDFDGKSLRLLTPWQQLAQVLMLGNEFMFVD